MKEIERKFLMADGFKVTDFLYVDKKNIEDFYLNKFTRIRHENDIYFVTIKSIGNIERDEYTYEINLKPSIDIQPLKKVRFIIPFNHQNFEVNLFADIKYKGVPLTIVEIELESKEQSIQFPEWIGEEITYDERFYGYNLAKLCQYKGFEITS